MDKTTLRFLVLGAVFWSTSGWGLDSRIDNSVRSATFEFFAPGAINGAMGMVGTAFAIGPNRFVTAAHLVDAAVGSRFKRPVLVDSRHIEYQIADILQFSERRDYVVFSLQRPPRVRPLTVDDTEPTSAELYFAGWRQNGAVTTERVAFSGLTSDRGSTQLDWLRFSGPVWGAAGGGPVINGFGHVIGIVQGVSRTGEANYAVPIEMLSSEPANTALLHGMELLRFLMPIVSSVEPLEATIPLPMAWDAFSRQVQQLRRDYFDRLIRPLVDSTRGQFLMTGETAADTCDALNGTRCQCKPRTNASGTLLISDSEAASKMIAGVGLVRRKTLANASEHLEAALHAATRPDLHLENSRETRTWIAQQEDSAYVDFRNRSWRLRKWSLLDRDLELISIAREVSDGYVVLTRAVPTALDYAGELQLKFVANLVYYQCEELTGEGVAKVAANSS